MCSDRFISKVSEFLTLSIIVVAIFLQISFKIGENERLKDSFINKKVLPFRKSITA